MNLLRRQTSITGLFNKIVSVDAPALDVPDIDSFVGLMHTLFALEDMYGLGLYKGENDLPVLSLHPSESSNPVAAREFSTYLDAWLDQAEKFRNGEITREEYDKWRYEFPKHDTSRRWVQIPSILDLLFNDQTPVKPQRPVRQRAKRKKRTIQKATKKNRIRKRELTNNSCQLALFSMQ